MVSLGVELPYLSYLNPVENRLVIRLITEINRPLSNL